jgi:hypothetical protein
VCALSWLRKLIRAGLTRKIVKSAGETRRVNIEEAGEDAMRVSLMEEEPSDRFVLIVWLMVLFFVGLIFLELVHMVWVGTWNDVIFNGIMLVVGTIVGAVWGKMSQ